MAGTLVKRVLLQINADDGDTEAKLDAISAKADELAEKHPELKVRIDTAEAQAKMAVLRQELRDMSAEADAEAAKGGILSRFFGGGRGGFFGLLSKIPWLGNAVPEGAAGEGGEGTAGLLGSGAGGLAAVAAIVDALAAASTEITGVVSGFAAAGVGAGAFALLAYPAIKQVTGALGDTKAQLLKLPLLEQDAVGDLQQLEGTWKQMSKAFEPQAFKVFTDFLQLADELLPDVTPFATTFANSIDGLAKQADKFADSKGFTDWLAQFQKLVGPSTTAIGTGVGHLVTSIGKLFTTMSAKDDVNAINIAFSVIDGVIVGFTGFVHGAMVTWDALTTAWDKSVDGIRTAGHGIASGFDTARHGAASAAHAIAGAFDVTRHGAATAGHDTASAFDVMRSRIATALDGDLAFVRSHWKAVAGALVDPVAAAVFEVRTHLHQMAQEFDSLRHDTASILAGMRHDIASAFDAARHDSAATMAGLRHDTASAWDSVRHDAAAWGDGMIRAVKRAWDDIFGSTKEGGTHVTGYVGSLPGRITSLLARLPGDMFSIGRNVIDGLIRGIESAAAGIPSIMMGLAHSVESYFTDPLKIFSPSRVMYEHGLMVPEGVALGIEAGSPRVRQAAAGMARAVSGTALGAHGTAAGAAAAGSHVTIQISGDAALRQWLKKSIRVTGGNVQVVGA